MILKANSYSIGKKSGEIWTSQTLLQPISFKSDRLPELSTNFGDKSLPILRLLHANNYISHF